MSAAALPVALAAAVACYQSAGDQPAPTDALARSVASYHLRPPTTAARAGTQASGHSRLARPARSTSPSQQASASATPASTPSATPTPPPAPSCAGDGAGGTGFLPLNYRTIVDFLLAHGYTPDAASGIAGNIYQESKGDPESVGTGGGGLIGWTPLPAGFVTGNASADLETQLTALLSYNEGWSQYIPLLNSATSALDAAYVYMTYFERPGIPAASNREDAAVAVAQACGFGS